LDAALAGARMAAGADQGRVDAAADRLHAVVRRCAGRTRPAPIPLGLKPPFVPSNPCRFLDGTPARSVEDMPARWREIREIAQFQYGEIPPAPDKIEIEGVSLAAGIAFSFQTGTGWEISFYRIDVTARCGWVFASTAFRLRLPEEERLRELGRMGKQTIALSFRAKTEGNLRAGHAVFEMPTGDITDDRADPWMGARGSCRISTRTTGTPTGKSATK
jgi:hypothetical protein